MTTNRNLVPEAAATVPSTLVISAVCGFVQLITVLLVQDFVLEKGLDATQSLGCEVDTTGISGMFRVVDVVAESSIPPVALLCGFSKKQVYSLRTSWLAETGWKAYDEHLCHTLAKLVS